MKVRILLVVALLGGVLLAGCSKADEGNAPTTDKTGTASKPPSTKTAQQGRGGLQAPSLKEDGK